MESNIPIIINLLAAICYSASATPMLNSGIAPRILLLAISAYSGFSSIPMKRLPCLMATSPVVPAPAKHIQNEAWRRFWTCFLKVALEVFR